MSCKKISTTGFTTHERDLQHRALSRGTNVPAADPLRQEASLALENYRDHQWPEQVDLHPGSR